MVPEGFHDQDPDEFVLLTTSSSCKLSAGTYKATLQRIFRGKVTKQVTIRGRFMETDTAKLEMNAVVAGLRRISRKDPLPVVVISRNKFIARGMNEWIQGWIKNGWKNEYGRAVRNSDLW